MADPMTEETYRKGLRDFLRDYEEFNRLLHFHKENVDDMLDLCLNLSLGSLNSIPPLVASFDYSTFPIPSLLIHKAVTEALMSVGIMHSRNDLTYNNGGISVKISDKERYLPMLQMLNRMVDMETQMFRQIKVAINIDGGYGGVASPYNTIHGNLPIRPNSIL